MVGKTLKKCSGPDRPTTIRKPEQSTGPELEPFGEHAASGCRPRFETGIAEFRSPGEPQFRPVFAAVGSVVTALRQKHGLAVAVFSPGAFASRLEARAADVYLSIQPRIRFHNQSAAPVP